MNANQMPPARSPASSQATPAATSSQPTAWPDIEAIRVARSRLPVVFQMAERSSRPPSSGKPGTRLKTASSRLVQARYPSVPASGADSTSRPRLETIPNSPARSALVIGPTSAIRNSSPGPRESTLARVAPPNRNRVMSWTRIPRAWETSAWASSWTSTEPKNSTVAPTPSATAPPPDSSGYRTEVRRYML